MLFLNVGFIVQLLIHAEPGKLEYMRRAESKKKEHRYKWYLSLHMNIRV